MRKMKPQVVSVNISKAKGTRKEPVASVYLKENHGVLGDAHAGDSEREVSLLAIESIDEMKTKGAMVGPGDFAENITTQGMNLLLLPIGARLKIGKTIVEITQIGKECHAGCEIMESAGDCIMPTEGVFATVLKGGEVKAGDEIAREDKTESTET
jgi:MOSC domain-containing protein YiiM